jgi:hypothetical protein
MLSGLNLPALLAIGSTLLGLVWGMLKWFAVRLIADFEARLSRIDDLAREISRVDNEVQHLLAELPLHYQRREDAIREFTAINAKLDRLYELLARRHDHDNE